MNLFSRARLLRLAALLLAALLLAGCHPAEDDPAGPTIQSLTDDSAFTLPPPAEGEPGLNGASAGIALVVDANGVTDGGRNAAVWRGLQSFASTYNYAAQYYYPEADGPEALAAALQQALDSGAVMVVGVGDDVAVTFYNAQDATPDTPYLLLDAEPRSADHKDYTAADNVHSVLFHEEQAAYLAGYAAVSEGYTRLGFLGGSSLPEVVRYCTGFIQGAEAAAAQEGVQVTVKTLYSSQSSALDDLTTRVSGWYTDGTELVLAADGRLAQCCVDAAATAGEGRVIAADWDHAALGDAVLTSAAKCYNAAVQRQLYAYFTAGSWQDGAGSTERLGIEQGGVALPLADWRFETFTQEQYADLYEALYQGKMAVEVYSDPDAWPSTVNVTVESQN